MSFDATIGGALANSYVSVAQADEYFGVRINTAVWDLLENGDKEAYLVTATMMVEAATDWNGYPASAEQALHFPAAGLFDALGNELDSTAVPSVVVRAVCEQALHILVADPTAVPTALTKGLKSLTVDVIKLDFDKSMVASRIAEMVPLLLRNFGTVATNVGGVTFNDVYAGG